MRRLRHILVMSVTVVSLGLCAAVVVLWVRGMGTADVLSFAREIRVDGRYARGEYEVLSGPSFLVIGWGRSVPRDAAAAGWLRAIDAEAGSGWRCVAVDSYEPTFEMFVHGFGRIGASSGREGRAGGKTDRYWTAVEVPHWMTMLVVSGPGVVWGVWWWRGRRARREMPGSVPPNHSL